MKRSIRVMSAVLMLASVVTSSVAIIASRSGDTEKFQHYAFLSIMAVLWSVLYAIASFWFDDESTP